MYNAFIEDNKITGVAPDTTKIGALNVEITEEQYNNVVLYGIEYYTYDNGEIVENPEWYSLNVERAKEEKVAQNDIVRDSALIAGVTYKDVLFDSDTDQKINLLAIVSTMGDEDTVTWFGMDNTPLECTKEDLINIGGLITMLHSFCWSRNAEIKAEISAAETLEEVEAVEINYDMNTDPEEAEIEEPEVIEE